MKKLIIIIIVMMLIMGIFTSCENENNIDETYSGACLITDYTNNNISGTITKEYTYWHYNRYLDSDAPQMKSIVFDGNTYNGKYKYSYVE